jgi:hypothetical protein
VASTWLAPLPTAVQLGLLPNTSPWLASQVMYSHTARPSAVPRGATPAAALLLCAAPSWGVARRSAHPCSAAAAPCQARLGCGPCNRPWAAPASKLGSSSCWLCWGVFGMCDHAVHMARVGDMMSEGWCAGSGHGAGHSEQGGAGTACKDCRSLYHIGMQGLSKGAWCSRATLGEV